MKKNPLNPPHPCRFLRTWIPLYVATALAVAIPMQAAEGPEIPRMLDEMARQGAKFDPGRLRAKGLAGCRALLDRLLPETAPVRTSGMPKDEAQRLIRQLGDDDYRVRQSATKRLIEAGQAFAELVAQAARSKDPEVTVRAESILSAWESAPWDAERQAVGDYGTGLLLYLDGLTDEDCWLEVARRVCMVFQRGAPRGRKRMILAHCVERIAAMGKDECCRALFPLLKHRDESVAVWVTRTFGAHSGKGPARKFPVLLIEAIQSDRELVVDTAINWASNCPDESRRREVGTLLRRIFNGDAQKERLKFHACYPLMVDYGDAEAVAYLLSQAARAGKPGATSQSTSEADRDRALQALEWLADACNSGKPAWPELLGTLAPLLKFQDVPVRRAAAAALGTYRGEGVVRGLVPLLGDPEAPIADQAARALLAQADKPSSREMLRRHLADAERTAPTEAARSRAKELLSKLGPP